MKSTRAMHAEIKRLTAENERLRAGAGKTDDKWGPGDPDKWRRLNQRVRVEGRSHELVFGEHPHSRQDNDFYAIVEDGKDAVAFDGHRVLTRLDIRTSNYLKSSNLTGQEVRKGCELNVYLEDVEGDGFGHRFQTTRPDAWLHVYKKGARDVDYLLHWWLANRHWFFEGPVQWWSRKELAKLPGRKVYFRERPAVIDHWLLGHVFLKPDNGRKGWGSSPPWRGDEAAWGKDEIIAEDVMSDSIWWWRDEPKRKARR